MALASKNSSAFLVSNKKPDTKKLIDLSLVPVSRPDPATGSVNEIATDYLKQFCVPGSDTLRMKRNDLRQFLNYLDGNIGEVRFRELSHAMIEGFKRSMDRQYEPSTINRALATVKHFLRMNGSQAAVAIKNMQVSQHEVTAITEDEERQILQILRTCRDRFVGMRNCAILSTLLATGMRISEALSIRVEQISWVNNCFTSVRCKGDKYRDVHFPESLRQGLAPYLALREQELAERIGPRNHDKYALFLTLYNFHNDPDSGFVDSCTARKFFQHVSKVIGRRVHPHLCRHTLATEIYDDSGNAREVQLTLGHSNITTSERYLPKGKEIVKGAIARVDERRKAVK